MRENRLRRFGNVMRMRGNKSSKSSYENERRRKKKKRKTKKEMVGYY